jgi:hypothetical protein
VNRRLLGSDERLSEFLTADYADYTEIEKMANEGVSRTKRPFNSGYHLSFSLLDHLLPYLATGYLGYSPTWLLGYLAARLLGSLRHSCIRSSTAFSS